MLYNQFNKQGFTLIELLVVIGVLAILTVGLIVAINPLAKIQDSRDVKRQVHLRSIANALDEYYLNNNQYPTTGGAWFTYCDAGATWGAANVNKNITGSNGWIPNLAPAYMKTLPLDPKRGPDKASMSGPNGTTNATSTYCYVYRSDGTNYKVGLYCGVEGDIPVTGDPFYVGHDSTSWGCNARHYALFTPGAASW